MEPRAHISPGVDFTLLESVPDAMVVAHHDGEIVYLNAVAEELFGWSRAELVGQPVEALLPARLRGGHSLRAGDQAAPGTRLVGLDLDLFGLRKNGEEFLAEVSVAALAAGGETYSVAAVRDVTERERIAEQALLWRKAREQVREGDAFLSIASHELRTPVTALQLRLQLLQRTPDGLPGPLAAKLGPLERQCRRVGVLVSELLDVSRVRLGRLRLRTEELDLVAVAREALLHLEEAGEGREARVEILGERQVAGRWDRIRLEQVLTNLLSNALKFGQGKPVTVDIAGAGEKVRLAVHDEGIGIEPGDHARIFGGGGRDASTHHLGGLGLGLYIARAIVEAHGGTIALDSAPGSGTTFTVELPRVSPAATLPSSCRAPPSSS